VPQRKDLHNPSVDVDDVVEIVLNMIQQHAAKIPYAPMWHGFAGVRKLFDQVKRGFKIFSEQTRRVGPVLRPPCRCDTNLTISACGDFELQRPLMPFNSRNNSRPSV